MSSGSSEASKLAALALALKSACMHGGGTGRQAWAWYGAKHA